MRYLWARKLTLVSLTSLLCLILMSYSVSANSKVKNILDGSDVDIKINNILILDVTLVGDRIVMVGEQGLILLSDDQGENWLRAESNTHIALTAVHFNDESNGWVVGHRGVILRTEDGGKTWLSSDVKLPENNALFDVFFRNKNEGIALGAFGVIAETIDGGLHWTSRTILHEDEFFDMHLYSVAAFDDDVMIIVSEQGNLLRSTDAGENWQLIESPYEGSYFGVLRVNNNRVIAYGMRGNIFRSDDVGDSWEKIALGGQMAIQGAVLWADGRIAIAGSGAYVAISNDNGESFKRIPIKSRADIISVYEANAGKMMTFGLRGFSQYSFQ